MITVSHSISCPKCGVALQPVALGPETAPWLCAPCARGFWVAELSSEARSVYRPHHDDWTLSGARASIQSAVEVEQSEAQARGTSLRVDQFVHSSTVVLEVIARRSGLDPAFAASVNEHLHNLGAVS